jgi:hypothetical protein
MLLGACCAVGLFLLPEFGHRCGQHRNELVDFIDEWIRRRCQCWLVGSEKAEPVVAFATLAQRDGILCSEISARVRGSCLFEVRTNRSSCTAQLGRDVSRHTWIGHDRAVKPENCERQPKASVLVGFEHRHAYWRLQGQRHRLRYSVTSNFWLLTSNLS